MRVEAGLANDEDRAGGGVDDGVAGAAEQEALQLAVAAAADHDQVEVSVSGHLADRRCGLTCLDHAFGLQSALSQDAGGFGEQLALGSGDGLLELSLVDQAGRAEADYRAGVA